MWPSQYRALSLPFLSSSLCSVFLSWLGVVGCNYMETLDCRVSAIHFVVPAYMASLLATASTSQYDHTPLGSATQPPQPLDTSGSAGLLIIDPQIALVWLQSCRSRCTYEYRWHVQRYYCKSSNCMIDVGGVSFLNKGVDNCKETGKSCDRFSLVFHGWQWLEWAIGNFTCHAFLIFAQTLRLFSLTQLGRSDRGSSDSICLEAFTNAFIRIVALSVLLSGVQKSSPS